MSTPPEFSGPGFFAGEAPDGLTTIAGTPTSASVRVYWRDPADPQAPDALVASTQSAADGTWQIAGLNPALRYVVRAQKSQFDDVTVVGAMPARSDVIAYVDHLEPTEEFDGLTGHVLLDSGLPPFTCQVIDPLPFGLTARIDGRKLLIDGRSDDGGYWEGVVRVTASNGVWVDVPVQMRIAWTPVSLVLPPSIWLDDDCLYDVSGGKVVRLQSRGDPAIVFESPVSSIYMPQWIDGGLGRRVLRFSGDLDDPDLAGLRGNAAARGLYNGVAEGWMVLLVRRTGVDASPVSRRVFTAYTPSGAARFGVYWDDAAAGAQNRIVVGGRRLDGNSYARAASEVIPPDEWKIVVAQAKWHSNTLICRINGETRAVNSSAWPSAGLTSATTGSLFQFGGRWLGDCASVLAGAGSISDSEIEQLEGWLAHRYGLIDLLPADHPYKEVAP